MLTKEQAQMLCVTHEIDSIFDSQEDVMLLGEQNLILLEAYRALRYIAWGSSKKA